MILETLVVGVLDTNCYIVGCEETREAAIIDPGGNSEAIFSVIKKEHLIPKYIINTHAHFDHVGANNIIKKTTNIPLLIHYLEKDMLAEVSRQAEFFSLKVESSPPADILLKEDDIIEVGKINFRVIHTPGHSPGGISLITDKVVFTGDSLFAGSIGRSDFTGGSYEVLLKSIREKLLVLDEDTIVYPGHGPASTIGKEKNNNPFLQ